MELHADRAVHAHERGKAVVAVRAPAAYDADVIRTTGETVRVIGRAQLAALDGDVGRVVDRVPSDLRDPRRVESRHGAGNDAEPLLSPAAFIASVEEQLHPEAYADGGKSVDDGVADRVAGGRDMRRGAREGTDAGEHERVVVEATGRISFDAYVRTGDRKRLGQRVHVAGAVVEERYAHAAPSLAASRAASAADLSA